MKVVSRLLISEFLSVGEPAVSSEPAGIGRSAFTAYLGIKQEEMRLLYKMKVTQVGSSKQIKSLVTAGS